MKLGNAENIQFKFIKTNRPNSAYIPSRCRTSQTEQFFNLSVFAKKDNILEFTTRNKSTDKNSLKRSLQQYKNIRSSSLNESLRSHGSEDKNWKFQSINNKCYKKIQNTSINRVINPKIRHILNLNESVKKHIDTQTSKRQYLSQKFQSKKLKIIKAKMDVKNQIFRPMFNEDQKTHSVSLNVGVVGIKYF